MRQVNQFDGSLNKGNKDSWLIAYVYPEEVHNRKSLLNIKK